MIMMENNENVQMKTRNRRSKEQIDIDNEKYEDLKSKKSKNEKLSKEEKCFIRKHQNYLKQIDRNKNDSNNHVSTLRKSELESQLLQLKEETNNDNEIDKIAQKIIEASHMPKKTSNTGFAKPPGPNNILVLRDIWNGFDFDTLRKHQRDKKLPGWTDAKFCNKDWESIQAHKRHMLNFDAGPDFEKFLRVIPRELRIFIRGTMKAYGQYHIGGGVLATTDTAPHQGIHTDNQDLWKAYHRTKTAYDDAVNQRKYEKKSANFAALDLKVLQSKVDFEKIENANNGVFYVFFHIGEIKSWLGITKEEKRTQKKN